MADSYRRYPVPGGAACSHVWGMVVAMGEEWALIIRVWDMAFYLLAVVISDEDIVHDAVVTAANGGTFPYVEDSLGWYRKTSVGEQRWVRWPIDPDAAEQPNIISL